MRCNCAINVGQSVCLGFVNECEGRHRVKEDQGFLPRRDELNKDEVGRSRRKLELRRRRGARVVESGEGSLCFNSP